MTVSLPLVFNAPRRGMPPRHLADLDADERKEAVKELGLPGFRADQLARQYYGRLEADADKMTDLPAGMREKVGAALFPRLLDVVKHVACDAGQTRKTLWKANDGTLLESVLMRYPDRATLCISSQAGCGMACPFCATGQGGLDRNLSTAEIVDQVRAAAAALRDGEVEGGPGRLSNIVFMGMGEPLANYKRVVAAVRRITSPSPDGLGISQRAVTVSTVGLAPAIRKLADEEMSVRLAVSLHTPDDELRDTWSRSTTAGRSPRSWTRPATTPTSRVAACRSSTRSSATSTTSRGAPTCSGRSCTRRSGPLVHVNLIPLNPTPGSKWDASPKPVEREFVRRVQAQGVSCTVRDTRGQEIAAACGQLAAEN